MSTIILFNEENIDFHQELRDIQALALRAENAYLEQISLEYKLSGLKLEGEGIKEKLKDGAKWLVEMIKKLLAFAKKYWDKLFNKSRGEKSAKEVDKLLIGYVKKEAKEAKTEEILNEINKDSISVEDTINKIEKELDRVVKEAEASMGDELENWKKFLKKIGTNGKSYSDFVDRGVYYSAPVQLTPEELKKKKELIDEHIEDITRLLSVFMKNENEFYRYAMNSLFSNGKLKEDPFKRLENALEAIMDNLDNSSEEEVKEKEAFIDKIVESSGLVKILQTLYSDNLSPFLLAEYYNKSIKVLDNVLTTLKIDIDIKELFEPAAKKELTYEELEMIVRDVAEGHDNHKGIMWNFNEVYKAMAKGRVLKTLVESTTDGSFDSTQILSTVVVLVVGKFSSEVINIVHQVDYIIAKMADGVFIGDMIDEIKKITKEKNESK